MAGFLMGVLKFFIFWLLVYVGVFTYKYVNENGSLSFKSGTKYLSAKEGFPLPPFILQNNPNSSSKCVYCGGKIPGSMDFCPYCDREKKNAGFFIFQRDKRMTEAEFIGRINYWLLNAQGIYGIDCSFSTADTLSLFVPTAKLKSIAVFYNQRKGEGEIYGIDIVDSFSCFKKEEEKLLSQWEKNNPSCRVLKYDSHYYFWGRIFSALFFGIGGANKTKLYILYKRKA